MLFCTYDADNTVKEGDFMKKIGQNIRRYRIQMNMTQQQLAEKIFTARTTVSNYENNVTEPDIEMLVTISEVLDTDLESLVFGKTKDKSSGKKNAFYIASLLAVILVWGVLQNRISAGLLSDDTFGMYWYHVYLYFFRPLSVSLCSFIVFSYIADRRYLHLKLRRQNAIRGLIIAVASLWIFASLFAWFGFDTYFGNGWMTDTPDSWSGVSNQLFQCFAAVHDRPGFLIACALIGASAALCGNQRKSDDCAENHTESE